MRRPFEPLIPLGVGASNVQSRNVYSWHKGDMAAARLGATKCLLSTPERTLLNQVLTVSVRPGPAIRLADVNVRSPDSTPRQTRRGRPSAWEAVRLPPATCGLPRSSECPVEGSMGSYSATRSIGLLESLTIRRPQPHSAVCASSSISIMNSGRASPLTSSQEPVGKFFV